MWLKAVMVLLRDADNKETHDEGVDDVTHEAFFDPSAVVASTGKGRAVGFFCSLTRQCIGPVCDRKEINLDLERTPEGPDEWEGCHNQPDDNEGGRGIAQRWRHSLSFRGHVMLSL